MSRRITIIPNSTQLDPGQGMPVVVQVHFDEPTKIRGIKASFFGAERTEADYTTTSTDSKGKSTTKHHTAVEFVPIVDETFILHGDPSDGIIHGATRIVASMFGGGSSQLVDAGTYEFELLLQIPPDAPASFQGKKCSVFYRLDVQIDVPLWPDPKLDHDFVVIPLERPLEKSKPILFSYPDPERGRGFWDKAFGKDVKLDVAFETDVFYSGMDARGMVTINTGDRLDLDEIKFSFLATEHSVARSYKDHHITEFVIGSIPTTHPITQEFNQEFVLQIPDCGLSTATGTKFQVSYELEVRLDVPWAVDPVIKIPVEYYLSS